VPQEGAFFDFMGKMRIYKTTLCVIMETGGMRMQERIIRAVQDHKLIAILRGVPGEKLIQVAEALYQGGIRLLEITYSADGSVADPETADRIAKLVKAFEGRMFIGAGTVLTPEQVRLTAKAGGSFIISPDTNEAVIAQTKALGLVSIPGALTPSEITAAHRAGADFVKLFPVTAMGPAYIKAVVAPLSHIRLLAVGGIDETNMEQYLQAGVCGFGISSNIVNKKMVEKDDYEGITKLAASYVSVMRK